jgi:hypothetical protein
VSADRNRVEFFHQREDARYVGRAPTSPLSLTTVRHLTTVLDGYETGPQFERIAQRGE